MDSLALVVDVCAELDDLDREAKILAAGTYLRPGCSAALPIRSSRMTRRGDLTGAFEVFHEYPLEFEGYLLSCAKMPGAKESDPD